MTVASWTAGWRSPLSLVARSVNRWAAAFGVPSLTAAELENKSALPANHCPLITVHCHYSLSTAHCSLPTVHCPLSTNHCSLFLAGRITGEENWGKSVSKSHTVHFLHTHKNSLFSDTMTCGMGRKQGAVSRRQPRPPWPHCRLRVLDASSDWDNTSSQVNIAAGAIGLMSMLPAGRSAPSRRRHGNSSSKRFTIGREKCSYGHNVRHGFGVTPLT